MASPPDEVDANIIQGQPSISHIEKLLNDHRKSIQEARRLSQTIASKVDTHKNSTPALKKSPSSKPNSRGQSLERGAGGTGSSRERGRTSQSLDRHSKRSSASETSSSSGFKASTPRRSSTTNLDKNRRDTGKAPVKSSLKPRTSKSLSRNGSNARDGDSSPSPSPSNNRRLSSNIAAQSNLKSVGSNLNNQRNEHNLSSSKKNKALRLSDFLSGNENLNTALERLGWKPGGRTTARPNEIFKLMDLKGDGRIDAQELKIGLTRLRRGWIEDTELSLLFEQFDPEETGFIGPLAFTDFVKGGGLSSNNISIDERSPSNSRPSSRSNSNQRRPSSRASPSPRHTPMSYFQREAGETNTTRNKNIPSPSSSSHSASPNSSQQQHYPIDPLLKRQSLLNQQDSFDDSIKNGRSPSYSNPSSPSLQPQNGLSSSSVGTAGHPATHAKIAKILTRQNGGAVTNHTSNGSSGGGVNAPNGPESVWPGEYVPQSDDVCYGVSRSYWNDVGFRHGISGGIGLGEASFFAASDLGHILRGLKCGLRVNEKFCRLLSIKLDPGHTGRIRFPVLERWLRNAMGLLSSLSDGLSPSPNSSSKNDSLEVRAKRQIKSLSSVLASTPSLDHALIDMTVLTLARLRLHAPPHTPLHQDLTKVLSQRGFLPAHIPNSSTTGMSGEVEKVLLRYTDGDGEFVPVEGLEKLLSDLDFYFPLSNTFDVNATKRTFLSKLDLFGENQPGVTLSAMRLWWRDLEVVVGAVDIALTDLESSMNMSDIPTPEDQLYQSERELHGDMTPLFETKNFSIGRAAAALVVAIQRANAAIAPLGHGMVDEAIATLHRAAQERVIEMKVNLEGNIAHQSSPSTSSVFSQQGRDANPLDTSTSLLPLFVQSEIMTENNQNNAKKEDGLINQNEEVGILGPNLHALLGVGCLIGLHTCSALVEDCFGGRSETSHEYGDNSVEMMRAIIEEVGLTSPHASQLENLAVNLGRGDGTISFSQVLQALTAARLKLERLQVSLLHALGSVASRLDSHNVGRNVSSHVIIPAALIDEASFQRLQNALGICLTPSSVSVTGHVLVREAQRITAARTSMQHQQLAQHQSALQHHALSQQPVYQQLASSSYQPNIMVDPNNLLNISGSVNHMNENKIPLNNTATLDIKTLGNSSSFRKPNHVGLKDMMSRPQLPQQDNNSDQTLEYKQDEDTVQQDYQPQEKARSGLLAHWHLIRSASEVGAFYWYNDLTGESCWEPPHQSITYDSIDASYETIVANAVLSMVARSTDEVDKINEFASTGFINAANESIFKFKSVVGKLSDTANQLENGETQKQRIQALKKRIEHLEESKKAVSKAHYSLFGHAASKLEKFEDLDNEKLKQIRARSKLNKLKNAARLTIAFSKPSSSLSPSNTSTSFYENQNTNEPEGSPPSPSSTHFTDKFSNAATTQGVDGLKEEDFDQPIRDEDLARATLATRHLVKFKNSEQIWKIVIGLVNNQEKFQSLKNMFIQCDFDGDGNLNTYEFSQFLTSCGIMLDTNSSHTFHSQLDIDNDGFLTFDEFIESVQIYKNKLDQIDTSCEEAWDLILEVLTDASRRKTLMELFIMMDKDCDKILSISELTQGLKDIGVHLTHDQIESFHLSLDLTQDGIVTLNEFMEVMTSKRHELHKSLAKALEAVLDFCLDPNRGADIKELFKLMDNDKDGKLDPSELCNGLRELGLKLQTRVEKALFKELDQTKDGYITYDEFMEGMRKFHMHSVVYPALADGAWVSVLGYLAEDNTTAEQLFNKCDLDQDGIVDVHELATGLLKSGVRLGGIEIRALHKTLDLDNDGAVTLSEFIESIEIHQQKFTVKSWRKLKNKSGEEYWYNEYTTETRFDVPPGEEHTLTRVASGPAPKNPSKKIRGYS